MLTCALIVWILQPNNWDASSLRKTYLTKQECKNNINKDSVCFKIDKRYDLTKIEWAKDFGKNFGIAYQLRNDYLDYFGQNDQTGKNIAEDLSEGKSTLPLIHSLGCSNNTDKSEISRIFNGKIKDDAYILLEILKKNKSDEYTENKITEYSNRAISALRRMNSSKETKLLEDLTKYCSFRFK